MTPPTDFRYVLYFNGAPAVWANTSLDFLREYARWVEAMVDRLTAEE